MDVQFEDVKSQFIETWGEMGSSWGICRTMAEIHALLLATKNYLTADDVVDRLNISRGNANVNIRALMDWGLVYKESREGERKDYFYAEKNLHKVFTQILKNRKKRELEPVLKMLKTCEDITPCCEESIEFQHMVKELHQFTKKADATLDTLIAAESSWFVGTFMRLIR
ncbi:MAG: transcriptional regulator [Saprospiraceae bacterium]